MISVKYLSGTARKMPKAGDEKVVKGVTYIRQQEYSKTYRAYVVSNGRPVYEWVVKGSDRDRNSSNQQTEGE